MSAESTYNHLPHSRRNGLGAFDDWRTRPLPDPAPRTITHPCSVCGCRLNSGNRSGTCSPCSIGHVDIPQWAALMIDRDDSTVHVGNLVGLLVRR